MIMFQLYTKKYRHVYDFQFKGQTYLTHSIVKLTEYAQIQFRTSKSEVILLEHYFDNDNRECWTYEIGWSHNISRPLRVSTDIPLKKIIEEITVPATQGYVEREVLGVNAPSFKTGKKITIKDWEIPEVLAGWIVYFLVFIGAFIFKDWYVKAIIWAAAGWIFGLYRQAYVNAYTVYMHDEDIELDKKKLEVLYGVKTNKEGDNNE